MQEETYIYYYQLEPVSVAFSNAGWGYLSEDAEQTASKVLRQELEEEYNLSVGDTSVGTGAAASGFLVVIPSALVSGVIWLFFKGKDIQPNIDAWKAIYDKYLVGFFKRKPSFDRGGALILAILALNERLGKEPTTIRLISYNRRSNRMEPHDILPGTPGEIDERSRIEAATIHVYKIIADDSVYTIHVHGQDVTFIE